MQLLTIVYGEKHIDWFKRGLLGSLCWPRNKAIIEGSTWNIFTDDENKLKLLVLESGLKVKLNVKHTNTMRRYVDLPHSAIVWQIEECLKTKDRLLFAPPDTIFGDGAIEGIHKNCRETGAAVASAHPRVVPDILSSLEGRHRPSTNADLSTLAWQTLHRSWQEAETGHVRQNSFVGGVSWNKTRDVISVTHRLPTTYMVDFTEEDLNFFKVAHSFGAWDHDWPTHILYPRGRVRYLGSSDLAFVCEVTDKDKNIPPIVPNANPDDFHHKRPHNELNKQFVSVFRLNENN